MTIYRMKKFWASWCVKCSAIKAVVESIVNEFSPSLVLEEIEIKENEESEKIMDRYKVDSLPLLVVEDEDGMEVLRYEGFISRAKVEKDLIGLGCSKRN